MKHGQVPGRVVALALYSLTVGWYLAADVQRKALLGRTAYLAERGAYFDRYLSHVRALPTRVFGYAIFILVLLISYELLAFVVNFGIGRITSSAVSKTAV